MKLKNLFENFNLSFHQRYILLQTKLAATPRLAFEQINRNESDIKSRQILQSIGHINANEEDASASLTPQGEQAIIEYGLVDETGSPTEVGNEILQSHNA